MRPVNSIAPGSVMRSRLLDKLLRSRGNLNNGTVSGGLAHALQQGLQGYQANQAMQQQQAQQQQADDAQAAMVRGMSAQQWTPPDAEIAMGPSGTAKGDVMIPREAAMQNAAPAGGYEGAITALQGLGADNAPAGRLATQLLMGKMERDQSIADRDADRQFQQNMFDRRTQQQNSMFERQQAAAREQQAAQFAQQQQMLQARLNASQGSGPFQGNSMDAQVNNILLTADPNSPEYARAYSIASQPKTVFQDGQLVTITPNMDGVRAPAGMGQPIQAASAQGGQQPAMGQPTPASIAPGVTATPIQTPEMAEQRRKDMGQTQAMLNTVNQIINHPYREQGTGVESYLPTMPGSPVASFDALTDQIQGQAFLQAYQSLRGGGQITEVEGKKAEQAFARLNTAQSDADYLDAVKELRSVLMRAQGRMTGVPDDQLPPLYQPSYMQQAPAQIMDGSSFTSAAEVDALAPGTVIRLRGGLKQKQPDGSWADYTAQPNAAGAAEQGQSLGIR